MILGQGLKLVFQDIDGCLNTESGEEFPPGGIGLLSDQQSNMLRQIGIAMDQSSLEHIVINTGRNYEDTAYIVEAIQSEKLGYAILEHSAYAWDFKKNNKIELFDLAVAKNNVELLGRYRFLEKIPELILWYRNKGMHQISAKYVPVNDCLDKSANLSIAIPSGMDAISFLNVLKKEIDKDFAEDFSSQLHYCHSNFFVDVLGPILKSDGAKLMAQHFNIPLEQCLVIGDSLNDIDLFEAFQNGLCPSNSHPKIIKLCKKLGFQVSELNYGDATLKAYQSF